MQVKLVGNNKGQLLIEAMIAMGVISVGLLAVFTVLSNSLGISKITSNQYVGTYLSAEGIEVVKNIIDNNVYNQNSWNSGLVQNGGAPYTFTVQYDSTAPDTLDQPTDPLRFDPNTGLYSYDPAGNITVFTRAITVTSLDSGNELRVDSVVNWKDQGGTPDSVELEDTFYNWR